MKKERKYRMLKDLNCEGWKNKEFKKGNIVKEDLKPQAYGFHKYTAIRGGKFFFIEGEKRHELIEVV